MRKGIAKQIVSGVFFTATAKYANLLFSLLATAILARLLTPEEFGVVAIASVAITFLNLVSDLGLSPAVIQHKELDKKSLDNLFSLSCYLGVLLSVLFFCSAGLLADYYQRPILKPVCQLLSVNLFFNAVAVVPNALFYREQLFKFIAVRSVAIHIASGAVSVVMAYYGGGVYALIVNPILSSILLFALSYLRFPLAFHFRFDIFSLRPLFGYSLFQLLFNIINFFSRNGDSLLIGKYLGMDALGYYDKAYRLMLLPLQNVTQVITPVIHPILSQYRADKSYLADANEKLTVLLALIGFPLSAFLYFTADEVVLLFFGPQWTSVVPAFRMLTFTIAVQLILSTSGSIFQTAGDTRSLFFCGLVCGVLTVGGAFAGVSYFRTIEGVARCLVLAYGVSFVQTYWWMYTRVFGVPPWRFFRLLLKPAIFGGMLGGLLWLLQTYVPPINIFARIALHGGAAVLATGLFVWFGGYRGMLSLLRTKGGNS